MYTYDYKYVSYTYSVYIHMRKHKHNVCKKINNHAVITHNTNTLYVHMF